MKKNLTWIGIFVLLTFGLTIFTGCAEKKSVVTKDIQKETAPAQTTKTPNLDDISLNTINPNDTTKEQSARVETTATAESSVRDINFDFDSSIIRPDAREILKANADFL